MVLVANLSKLIAAVAELRDVQGHAAQAAAARAAAERLHTVAGTMPGRNCVTVAQRPGSSPGRASIPAKLAATSRWAEAIRSSRSAAYANSGASAPFQRA